jgi:hypothetical protein
MININKHFNIRFSMKKQVMILFLLLLIVPMLYSYQESLGIVKQNEPVNLIQTCYNSTEGYITRVVYPDKTFAINEQTAMTKNGDNYNYSFLNTSQLGQYLVYGICDDTVWQYDFEVTTQGISQLFTFSKSIYVLIIMVALGFIGFVLYLYNKEEYYLTVFAGILFLFSGVFALSSLQGMLETYEVYIISIVLIGFGFINLAESIWRYFPND